MAATADIVRVQDVKANHLARQQGHTTVGLPGKKALAPASSSGSVWGKAFPSSTTAFQMAAIAAISASWYARISIFSPLALL